MEILSITKSLLMMARQEANRRMSFGFRGQYQMSERYKFNMIFISCIGELIFQDFLKNNNIQFSIIDPDFPGRELRINDAIVEIRTSGYDKNFYHLNLIYNDIQYAESINKNITYVVQIFINGYDYINKIIDDTKCSIANIAGYIMFSDIVKYPIIQNIYRPNYRISLNELKDIKEIMIKK